MFVTQLVEHIINDVDPVSGKLKLVLWLGAGIDNDKPTCLPLGNDLTYYMLKKSSPQHILRQITSVSKDDEKDIIKDIYGCPRLESVMECFTTVEKVLIKKISAKPHPLLQGLSVFGERKLNLNHFFIAELLKKGANVVTTNYDYCIPNAYKQIMHNVDELESSICGDASFGYYCFSSKNKCKCVGNMYYIHGLANELDNIGITLSQLKTGLEDNFASQIKEWLSNGYVFIYIGYGGGDAFDVNPFLDSLPEYEEALGVYIRYNGNVKRIVSLDQYRQNEQLLLKCFQNKYVFEYSAVEFLKEFCTSYKSYYIDEMADEQWDKKMDEIYKDIFTEEMRIAVSIELCINLGLDGKKILPPYWAENYLKNESLPKEYKKSCGIRLARNMNHRRIVKVFKPDKTDSELLKAEYNLAYNRYYTLSQEFKSIDQLISFAKSEIENKKITWKTSTSVNRYFQRYLFKIACYPLGLKKAIKKYHNDLQKIIDIFQLLVNNAKLVEHPYQNYTAMRYLATMRKIVYDDDCYEYVLRKVMHNYKEANCEAGIIGTRLLYQLCESLNIRFHYNAKHIHELYLYIGDTYRYILGKKQKTYMAPWFFSVCVYICSIICGWGANICRKNNSNKKILK